MADLPDEEETVVFDNGSGFTKVGFAGEEVPRGIFSTLIGRPKRKGVWVGIAEEPLTYFSHEAQQQPPSTTTITWPISHGIIQNWDDMEAIWHYSFYSELQIAPEEHPVLLTETPLNPKANREKMTQIMFESFNTPAIYIGVQAVLSLYASGRTTGLVVDSGDGVTRTVPVYGGYPLSHAIFQMDIAGQMLNQEMSQMLAKRGYLFPTALHYTEIVRDIKEHLAYVSLNFDSDMQNALSFPSKAEADYLLPDGHIIRLGKERFECPEALFQPSFFDIKSPGIHQLAHNSITQSHVESQADFYQHILLCGGSTLIPGFSERMHQEMAALAPSSTRLKLVVPPEDPQLSAWKGGAVIASLPSFENVWLNKGEYDERGPSFFRSRRF